ncbi:hypothetical protein SeseC_01842 [Streptococcus equi subsp. zooepidemicus ATCC 35246]|nr:hypothetical protein SeseC_01842 [Streptococcus equi subsp. zooepidemicus ATCC 35246]
MPAIRNNEQLLKQKAKNKSKRRILFLADKLPRQISAREQASFKSVTA